MTLRERNRRRVRMFTWKCRRCGSCDIRTKTFQYPRRPCPHCGDRNDKSFLGFLAACLFIRERSVT